MEHYEDIDLLKMFHQEETRRQAFNLLVIKYQKKIYWIIRRLLIDHEDTNDTLQNVFVKIWMNLENFEGKSSLFTWIYRIAINESVTFLNKKRRVFFLPMQSIENDLVEKIEDDNFFNGNEIQKKLQKAILILPKKQKLVFNMKYFDDLKYEEMAEILNVSVGTLKSTYHIAVKKIEEYLKTN